MLRNHRLLVPLLSVALLQLLPHAVTGQTLRVKKKMFFGKPIVVNFDLSEPTGTEWIGIWRAGEGGVNSVVGKVLLWASLCGDQEYELCNTTPPTEGTIEFKSNHLASNNFFPLNPGKYTVCLMDGEVWPYTKLKCKPFKVKSKPLTSNNMAKSSVTVDASSFPYGDAITASFVSKPRTVNSWIGIYPNDVDTSDGAKLPDNNLIDLLNNGLAWVWSGCNNQVGNTGTAGSFGSWDCTKRKRSGTVSFDDTTQYAADWYPEPGKYKLCLSWLFNEPYRRFVCSDPFTVI